MFMITLRISLMGKCGTPLLRASGVYHGFCAGQNTGDKVKPVKPNCGQIHQPFADCIIIEICSVFFNKYDISIVVSANRHITFNILFVVHIKMSTSVICSNICSWYREYFHN